MKKILLPTDFSLNAKNAIIYALQLFESVPCTFYLLHTYGIPIHNLDYDLADGDKPNPIDFHHGRTMDQLAALKEELLIAFKNPKHGFRLRGSFNGLVDEMVTMVDEEKIDLVVMGTKGATGAKELLFGSNTVFAMRKIQCPLIAVPEGFVYEKPKQILFPTDFVVDYRQVALRELLDLAKENAACIHVLHISMGNALNDFQEKNRQKLEKLLSAHTFLLHETGVNGVIEGINAFQLKNKVQFLAMVKNKHTFLESVFIRPIIRKIGLHLNIPFMVIPMRHTGQPPLKRSKMDMVEGISEFQ